MSIKSKGTTHIQQRISRYAIQLCGPLRMFFDWRCICFHQTIEDQLPSAFHLSSHSQFSTNQPWTKRNKAVDLPFLELSQKAFNYFEIGLFSNQTRVSSSSFYSFLLLFVVFLLHWDWSRVSQIMWVAR